MDTHDRHVLPRINHERFSVSAANHRPGKPFAMIRPARVVNRQLVFVEIDDQLHRPARHNPLLEMRRRIIQVPQPLDEAGQRMGW